MGYYRNVADGIYYREGPVEVLKTFRNPEETQPKTALIHPVIFDSLPQLSHSRTTFGEIIHGV